MRNCRHCGQENLDGATLCVECGLDLRPSSIHRMASQAWERSRRFCCTRPWSVILKIALPLAAVCSIVWFSALRAQKVCDEAMKAEGLPRSSTRFVFNPDNCIAGDAKIGINASWVVTYAAPNREYGTALCVTLLGRIRARGTPSIVARKHEEDDLVMEQFHKGFAQLDAAVVVGSTFSNVVSILGSNYIAFTNTDGTFSAYYNWMPRIMHPGKFITNGFSLKVTNGIVGWKGYSTTVQR